MSSTFTIRASFEDYSGDISKKIEDLTTETRRFAHIRLALGDGVEYFSRDFEIVRSEKIDSVLERVVHQLERLEPENHAKG